MTGTAGDTAQSLALLPRPRHLEDLGSEGPLVEDCQIRTTLDRTLRPEGFTLEVTESHGARIAHADDAGLGYARALLDQLVAQAVDGRVRSVAVRDHPDLAVRGYLLDVSRDRVPTRETLDRIVGLLALARYNQFQLYVEHTFAHVGHEQVWIDASPITHDDLRWLDARCLGAGIELVVNRNCFGHFERWLRHPDYRPRAEAPDGVEIAPGIRLPPSVLAPTADNAAFASGLVREMLQQVTSRRVNIGCDETFELGKGVSRGDCEVRGRGAVYLEHVRRLAEPLVGDGYLVQMWADVLRRHPELARELPEQVVPIAWCYEAPRPANQAPKLPAAVASLLSELGVDVDVSGGFERNVAPLARAGIDFWVAPGTSAWNSLVGRSTNAYANQIDAVETALRHGSTGCLVTDWGDNGHHHPPSVSFGPLVHGGAVAWCLDANRDLPVDTALDRFVFDDRAGRLGGALAALGGIWTETGRVATNASPLAAALFPHQPLLVSGEPDHDAVAGVIDRIDGALRAISDADPRCTDAAAVRSELSQAARLARHAARRMLGGDEASRAQRREELRDLIATQEHTWLARARPGGLADSLAHLRRGLDGDSDHDA